jgi:hypothetical protein
MVRACIGLPSRSREVQKSCSNADFKLFFPPALGRLWRLGGAWRPALRTTTRRLLESAHSTSTCQGGGCEPQLPLLGGAELARCFYSINPPGRVEEVCLWAPSPRSRFRFREIWNVNKTCREPVKVEDYAHAVDLRYKLRIWGANGVLVPVVSSSCFVDGIHDMSTVRLCVGLLAICFTTCLCIGAFYCYYSINTEISVRTQTGREHCLSQVSRHVCALIRNHDVFVSRYVRVLVRT